MSGHEIQTYEIGLVEKIVDKGTFGTVKQAIWGSTIVAAKIIEGHGEEFVKGFLWEANNLW